jgi:hypothetical protein
MPVLEIMSFSHDRGRFRSGCTHLLRAGAISTVICNETLRLLFGHRYGPLTGQMSPDE